LDEGNVKEYEIVSENHLLKDQRCRHYNEESNRSGVDDHVIECSDIIELNDEVDVDSELFVLDN